MAVLVQTEHKHPKLVHAHDHWHVAHVHAGEKTGQWEHVPTWHTHEHDHLAVTHSHEYDREEEAQHHTRRAHVHDHGHPVE